MTEETEREDVAKAIRLLVNKMNDEIVELQNLYLQAKNKNLEIVFEDILGSEINMKSDGLKVQKIKVRSIKYRVDL